MADLYSQYTSGTQLTAGTMVGSALGASGLNPIVDRLNSISNVDNLLTGSIISGTSTIIYSDNINNSELVIGSGFISVGSTTGLVESAVFKFSAGDLGSLDKVSTELNVTNFNAGDTCSFQVVHIISTGSVASTSRELAAGSYANVIVDLWGTKNSSFAGRGMFERGHINGTGIYSVDTTQGVGEQFISEAGSLIILTKGNDTKSRVNYRVKRSRL